MRKNLMVFKHFIKDFYDVLQKNELMALGGQVTYYIILSFFPLLLFLLTLASYTPLSNSEILGNLSYFLPEQTYEMVISVVNEMIQSRSTTLLSFSMLITIWVALNGINALIRGINKAYGFKESRSFLRLKFVSLLFLLIMFLAIFLTLILLVWGQILGEFFFNFFQATSTFALLWSKLRLVVQFAFLILTFSILNRMATTRNLSFKQVLPGSFMAAIGWVLISIGFSFYIKNFSNIAVAYGSIGGIIILLLWLYWSSEILLLGSALNAVLLKYKR